MNSKALVTGAAGFIGSHLSERLVSDGWTVTGIDSFTDYYDPQRKRNNISGLLGSKEFTLVEEDLNSCDLAAHLDGVSCVFHRRDHRWSWRLWSDEYVSYKQELDCPRQCCFELDESSTSLSRILV